MILVRLITAVVILNLWMWGTVLYAQDPIFNGNFSTPSVFNPAFTGMNACQKYTLVHRNQWPGIRNSYRTTYLSAEFQSKSNKAGFGGSMIYDVAGDGNLSTFLGYINYSKSLVINHKSEIRFGLSAGMGQVGLDWQDLQWGDMIDDRRGFVNSTNQPFGTTQYYFTANTGVAYVSQDFFAGATIFNLNKPVNGLLNTYSHEVLPRHISVHGGYMIEGFINEKRMQYFPQLFVDVQKDFYQITAGGLVVLDNLSGGVYYKHNYSILIQAGLKYKGFFFNYGYDLVINKLAASSFGAHEFTIRKSIECDQVKKRRMLDCPMFN